MIGRFGTIDPLAEQDRRWSSYSYGHNNPISHIDVDGMFDWVETADKKPVWDDNVHTNAQAEEKYGNGAKDIGASATYTATGGETVNLRPGGDWDYDLSNIQAKGTGLDMQGFYSTVASQTPVLNATITGIDIGSSFLLPGAGAATAVEAGDGLLARTVSRLMGGGAATGSEAGAYSVYHGLDNEGTIRYVGITSRNVAERFAEHLNSLGTGKEFLQYDVVDNAATGLTRTQARVWEQNLINQFGLGGKAGQTGQLLNKINSIAPSRWAMFGINP